MMVNGLVTIRAYDKIKFFKAQFMNEAELSANVTFTFVVMNRWLVLRLDLGIICLSLTAAACCIGFKDVIEGELLTFSLQIITDVTLYFALSMMYLA